MPIDSVSGGVSYNPQLQQTAEAKPAVPAAPAAPAAPAIPAAKPAAEGFDDPKKKLMSVSGAYVAHQPGTYADRPDLKDLVAQQRSLSNANVTGGALNDKATEPVQQYTIIPKLSATAEKEIDPKKPVNFMSPEGKKQLVESSSQVNPVSVKAGNANSCCGGASVTNALILSANTPAEAKANANALRTTAQRAAIKVSPDEEKALRAMSTGSMSPTDVAHLQQLSARTIKRDGTGNELSTTGDMTKTIAEIRANGGMKGARSIEFHNSALPGGGNHWTVSVDGKNASSLNRMGYHGASVQDGTPESQQRSSANEDWRSSVKIQNDANPPSMEFSYRKIDSNGKDVPNEMYRETLTNLEQFKTVEGISELNSKIINSDHNSVPID